MNREDRIVNESLAILEGFKDEIAALSSRLEERKVQLLDLLMDKTRSRDCVFWEGIPEASSKWGSCKSKRFEEHIGMHVDPCNGDTPPCKTFFEAREEVEGLDG